MNLEAKILDPICIRLGKDSDIIMIDDGKENYPLVPGVMFGGNHYGFVLITDSKGKQRETVYSTQCKIEAIGVDNGTLKVFEEGKKLPWLFDKSGRLEHSTFGEFTDKFKSNVELAMENSDMFMNEPTLMNPVKIKISLDPDESIILKDKNIKEDYPLYPGAILGTVHYGFILIINNESSQKKVIYPTQNRIDAVGIEDNVFGDLKIFENGKYHPWVFSYNGNFKQKSSYNLYSRRDIKFVEGYYELKEDSSNDCFTFQKKK